jgi:hypothetical protein
MIMSSTSWFVATYFDGNQAEYEAWCEEQAAIAESNFSAYDWPEWNES